VLHIALYMKGAAHCSIHERCCILLYTWKMLHIALYTKGAAHCSIHSFYSLILIS